MRHGPIEPIRVSSAPGRRCSADHALHKDGARCGRVGGGGHPAVRNGRRRPRPPCPPNARRPRWQTPRTWPPRVRIGASWSRRRSAASRGRRTNGIAARRRRPATTSAEPHHPGLITPASTHALAQCNSTRLEPVRPNRLQSSSPAIRPDRRSVTRQNTDFRNPAHPPLRGWVTNTKGQVSLSQDVRCTPTVQFDRCCRRYI